MPVKTNSPQLHQRADGEVKGAVAHHAGGFGALDQLKDRSADGDRMTPGGMVDIHHLRLGAVNGKQASSWEQSLSRMGEPINTAE